MHDHHFLNYQLTVQSRRVADDNRPYYLLPLHNRQGGEVFTPDRQRGAFSSLAETQDSFDALPDGSLWQTFNRESAKYQIRNARLRVADIPADAAAEYAQAARLRIGMEENNLTGTRRERMEAMLKSAPDAAKLFTHTPGGDPRYIAGFHSRSHGARYLYTNTGMFRADPDATIHRYTGHTSRLSAATAFEHANDAVLCAQNRKNIFIAMRETFEADLDTNQRADIIGREAMESLPDFVTRNAKPVARFFGQGQVRAALQRLMLL